MIQQVKDKKEKTLGYLYKGRLYEVFDCDKAIAENAHDIKFSDPKGKEMLWHTSAHVLAAAIQKLHPKAKNVVGPADDRGFFYDFFDLSINESDIPSIEKEIKKFIHANHQTIKREISKQDALEMFKENPFKVSIINRLQDDDIITCYQHGDFVDLCRGPHIPDLSAIGAYKIVSLSAAEFTLDGSVVPVTRVRAIAFPASEDMKMYEKQLEEAKERGHKKIGAKLKLFMISEYAQGHPLLMPHGMRIFDALKSWIRQMHHASGYVFIKTPTIMDKTVWEISGHWKCYKDNMYIIEGEEEGCCVQGVKAMNCPGAALYVASDHYSYRDLPLRLFEFGHVFRKEASGALSGLFRVRSFHQDDAHIFLARHQIQSEIRGLLDLAKRMYSAFGLESSMEISTRPEKSIGDDAMWEYAEQSLIGALDDAGCSYVENPGDGAFYGPKIDIKIKDALGRFWQCGTIQLDMGMAERFGVTYLDSDGELKTPVVIHRAILGSLERFMGILIEHFAGKMPFFISPRQISLLPVSVKFKEHAEDVRRELLNAGFYVDVHDTGSVSKRIARTQKLYYNYTVVIGGKEVESGVYTLEGREGDNIEVKSVSEMIDFLKSQCC